MIRYTGSQKGKIPQRPKITNQTHKSADAISFPVGSPLIRKQLTIPAASHKSSHCPIGRRGNGMSLHPYTALWRVRVSRFPRCPAAIPHPGLATSRVLVAPVLCFMFTPLRGFGDGMATRSLFRFASLGSLSPLSPVFRRFCTPHSGYLYFLRPLYPPRPLFPLQLLYSILLTLLTRPLLPPPALHPRLSLYPLYPLDPSLLSTHSSPRFHSAPNSVRPLALLLGAKVITPAAIMVGTPPRRRH